MRLFLAFYIILMGVSSQPTAATAGSIPDGLSTSTSFGTGLMFQSFELTRHVRTTGDVQHGFLAEERLKQNLTLAPPPPKELPLIWSLGFGVGRGTTLKTVINPSIQDYVTTGTASLTWDITPRLCIGARVSYDTIAVETYEHGMALLRAEYTLDLPHWPFWKPTQPTPEFVDDDGEEDDEDEEESDFSNYDPEDARQYYRQQILKREAGLEEADRETAADVAEQFPKLKIAYEMAANQHVVGIKGFRLPSNQSLASQSSQVSQYYDGPQLTYMPNRKWTYLLALGFYRYIGDVNQLLNQVEVGDPLKQAVLLNAGWTQFAAQNLAFPTSIVKTTVNHVLNSKANFELSFARITYASTTLTPSYAIMPVYYRKFKKHWRAGLGVQSTFGGVNSPFIEGTLQIDYRF